MMGIPLNEICSLIGSSAPCDDSRMVSGITEDSRRVQPGVLFAAVPGETADGHDFADDARSRGALAVLGNRSGLQEWAGLPYLYHPRPRHAVGLIAHALVGNPTQAMAIVGITGTNGKTSTAQMVHTMLRAAGHPCALLGTLGYDLGDRFLEASHTTPFAEDLATCFSAARKNGLAHGVMEVSSHALEQERVAGIQFRAAGFTNLTQDHLDYHETMEAYAEAKQLLFRKLEGADAFGVVNLDDPAGKAFREACPGRCITYGSRGDCRATDIKMGFEGSTFTLHTPWGSGPASIRLLGRHNISNGLCAVGLAGGLGLSFDAIIQGLAQLQSVPGRFEAIDAGQPFYVVVDYAHTEDGLLNVLRAAKKLCKGRIITVFGCGGDRDKTKRPKMGEATATHSHLAVVTSDNPRTEDPHRILLDIEVGVQRTGKKKNVDYWVIEDREEAIAKALDLAKPDDLVLIAGKGHEDYQIVGTEKRHFDDRETARRLLEQR